MAIAGYNVYLEGVKQNTSLISGTSYTVEGLTPNTSYDVTVTAVDDAGNESENSEVASFTTTEAGTITVFPSWTQTGDDGAAYLASLNELVPKPFTGTYATVASKPAGRFESCRLAPNGWIYYYPHSNGVPPFKFNPVNNSIETFGSANPTDDATRVNVLAQNGAIYFLPFGTGPTYKIDTSDDTVTPLSLSQSGGVNAGALANNGKIYCPPRYGTGIFVIDPSDDTSYEFGSPSGEWFGATLSSITGKIYCSPHSLNSNSLLIIDTTDDTFTKITTGFDSNYGKFVQAPNGKLYAASSVDGKILVFEPSDDTHYTIPITGRTGAISFGSLGIDGRIWFMGGVGSTIVILDPTDDSIEIGDVIAGSIETRNIVMANDGNFYSSPITSASIFQVGTANETLSNDFVLSRYKN